MKNILSLALALMILVMAIPAMADGPVKLTWFVDVPSFVFNSEGWGMDKMTAEITEKFGIEIEFVGDDRGIIHRKKRTRGAGHSGRDHERGHLVFCHVHTDRLRGNTVVTDRHDSASVTGFNQMIDDE